MDREIKKEDREIKAVRAGLRDSKTLTGENAPHKNTN